MRRRFSLGQARTALIIVPLLLCPAARTEAQAHRAVGRDAALGLRFGDLSFEPPEVQEHTLDSGVSVFLVEDHSLPLVTLYARFDGGFALLPRSHFAAAFALPSLLRNGGTGLLPPDSVDFLLDFYALQVAFGGGGQSSFASVNTLTKHLGPAIDLWADMLRNPRFDPREIEVWRGRQLEGLRRRGDDPGFLAVSEFNRIMFGDHPVGWELESADLSPDRFNSATVAQAYSRIFCRENLILGVVGDVRWSEIAPMLEAEATGWPRCQEALPAPVGPRLRGDRQVFLIPKELTQSTVVIAGPGGVSQSASPDYFASRIGNAILGASGFSSRLMSQVRTEKGYAYSVSSLWTTPSSYQGIVGAMTQTKSGSTIAAIRLILDIMSEMREAPPEQEEVDRIIAQTVNGFVFNFQDLSQIVSRQMFYRSEGLPEDWLEEYVRGIQAVDPEAVRSVFRRHVDPDRMTILIVGNPEEFDLPPEVLGEVQIWEPRETGGISEPPREAPRSRR